MPNPDVREIGRLTDFDEIPLVVGVDYDTVTIGYGGPMKLCWRIDAERIEDLAQLLARAAREVANRDVDEDVSP